MQVPARGLVDDDEILEGLVLGDLEHGRDLARRDAVVAELGIVHGARGAVARVDDEARGAFTQRRVDAPQLAAALLMAVDSPRVCESLPRGDHRTDRRRPPSGAAGTAIGGLTDADVGHDPPSEA